MKKKFGIGKIIQLGAIGVIFSAITVGNVLCDIYRPAIDGLLCPPDINFESESVAKATALGDQLCREIEEEGIVLLKNNEIYTGQKSLPLSKSLNKVNVFGWSSIDAGFAQKGIGSGSSTIQKTKSVSILKALTDFGVEYNTELEKQYKSFRNTGRNYAMHQAAVYNLYEPTLDFYSKQGENNKTILQNAIDYSDTAIVVVSRVSGENTQGEIPLSQALTTEAGTETDTSRTYLEISKHEEALIEMCAQNFKNVILVVNSSNTMHLNILEKENVVDSAIYVGLTGQSGAGAIPHILWGYKKDAEGLEIPVSPSGKTPDTYIYEPENDAAFYNHTQVSSHIQYVEDIYIGYKWFETADAEGYWDNVNNEYGEGYDGVVQFPFGHGLSYSTFDWSIAKITSQHGEELTDGAEISKYTTFNMEVYVTNTGSFPAKDVVEVYYSAPYYKGQIEKSAVNLVAFGKTDVLQPNQTTKLNLTFNAYDMASYDCYDKNENSFRGYELDIGEYEISLRTDAHHVKKATAGNKTSVKFNVNGESSADAIRYKMDPVTKQFVKNRMTGEEAYAGLPIDGSTVNGAKYMTRANFELPTARAANPSSNGGKSGYLNNTFDFSTEMPTMGVESNLRLVTKEDGSYASLSNLQGDGTALKVNEELFQDLSNYNSETWDKLLNQMTATEIIELVEIGGFKTQAVESIGKPLAIDKDGPAGLNSTISGGGAQASWTAFPSETLIACTWSQYHSYMMGVSVGLEASETGVKGWYAPGVNLHRSAYNGRNYEYYSEDPVLSGKLVSEVIKGAKTNGLYCYLKHFAVSELGVNPNQVNTWLTEQNIRENYLKPFELAVKEGEANAIMSAFNRIGGIWVGGYYPLLTQILRTEWGFRGSVITDYQKSGMTEVLGVRAGNDLWLTNSTSIALSASDPVQMACARNACKNIIYTYIDTYLYAQSHDVDDERFQAQTGLLTVVQPDSWWIPVLIGFDVIVGLGLALWGLLLFLPRRKLALKEVNADNQDS